MERKQLKTITRGFKSPLLKQKTIMKNTIQISLFILILLIFAYGTLANFHPLSLGILGALNIYSFAITYVSLTNK